MIGSSTAGVRFISFPAVVGACGAEALFMVLLFLVSATVLALSIIVGHYDVIPLVERLAPAVGRQFASALPARS